MASVIGFSVCLLSVLCSLSVCLSVTFFLIVLQYNIRPPNHNCTLSKSEETWYFTGPELQCVWSQICGRSESKKTWYFDTNCNECDDNFSLRVKFRRHIKSGPPKSAPATCLFIFIYNDRNSKLIINLNIFSILHQYEQLV